MKRIVLPFTFTFLLLLVSSPALSLWQDNTKVAVAISGTYSASFDIPVRSIFIGALFPNMDAGNVGIEMSRDGTNYYPVLDPLTGLDLILCSSGADPGWVDFSDMVRFVHISTNMKWRFTCASQTSGAVTIYIYFRG